MNYEEEFEIYSEEVQEVLGTPPKWIVRWGTTVSFIVLLLFAWLAWFIKYPEKLDAPITITSSIPPTEVIAQESGYIDRLYKENNDTVKQGDLLGIIKSTTDYEDIDALESYLNNFDALKDNTSLLDAKAPKRNVALDEDLQRSYSSFIQAYERYIAKIESGVSRSEESRYRREIQKVQETIDVEERRKADEAKRIRDLEAILKNKQDQYANKEIALSELEKTTDQIANARKRLDEYNESIGKKEVEIDRIKSRRSASIQQLNEENRTSYIALKERVKQLRSQIDVWKQAYVLNAPSEGIVTYFGSKSSALRFVNQGEGIMAILPLDTTIEFGKNEIIGRVSLPIEGSGKVKEGQLVKVKLDSYPSHEYGLVEGVIVQKARLPRNRTYSIEVRFPKGLNTSFDSNISFDQQMTGTATILTGRQRFAERIFEKFIEIFEVESKI